MNSILIIESETAVMTAVASQTDEQPEIMTMQLPNVTAVTAQPIHITSREQEVLYYLSQGYTSRQTGRELYISPLTVDKHKKNLMDKMGANSSAHLVYLSMRQGLLREY